MHLSKLIKPNTSHLPNHALHLTVSTFCPGASPRPRGLIEDLQVHPGGTDELGSSGPPWRVSGRSWHTSASLHIACTDTPAMHFLSSSKGPSGAALVVYTMVNSVTHPFTDLSPSLSTPSILHSPCLVVVQSLSCVQLFATPWTAACQASLSFIVSWCLL